MSEMVVYQEPPPLSAKEIKAQVNLIQEVMAAVMQKGTHYDTIPGCGNKPALLKPGAEKIMATFRIAAEPEVDDLSTPGEVRYRVRCRGVSATGRVVGIGIGECSSGEKKYCWRAAVSQDEWDATPEDQKRVNYTRDGSTKQIKANPADVANTVLKMAKKRAMVDLCLTATAASDIFTQDLEEDDAAPGNAPPPVQPPQRREQAPFPESREGEPLISDAQRKRFYALYKNAGKSDEQAQAYLRDTYGIEHSRDIPKSIYDEVCQWASA